MADETQGKLDLSVICHVGAGTAGGEMFRRYCWQFRAPRI